MSTTDFYLEKVINYIRYTYMPVYYFRLNMNCSEIICMFNDVGKIEFEDSTK